MITSATIMVAFKMIPNRIVPRNKIAAFHPQRSSASGVLKIDFILFLMFLASNS
jgi:hypothetical protein